MRFLLAALLCSLPACLHAQALSELKNLAGTAPAAVAAPKSAPLVKAKPRVQCPADSRKRKIGDCWTKSALFDGEGEVSAYVHPDGWLVDPRCLEDKRFTGREFLDALTTAAKKIDPQISADAGGCLGTYNPAWGREIKEQVWTNRMAVQCPQDFDPQSLTCADESSRDAFVTEGGLSRMASAYSRMISVRNVSGCMGAGTTGLSGTLFHETLHAVDADNVPVELHNKSWERPQYEFIRDRVYGTDALCYLGAKANVVQCRTAVAYESDSPPYGLCHGFSAYFTDMPPGWTK